MVVTARLVFTLLAFDLGGSAGLYLILIALPYKLAAISASAVYLVIAVRALKAILRKALVGVGQEVAGITQEATARPPSSG